LAAILEKGGLLGTISHFVRHSLLNISTKFGVDNVVIATKIMFLCASYTEI